VILKNGALDFFQDRFALGKADTKPIFRRINRTPFNDANLMGTALAPAKLRFYPDTNFHNRSSCNEGKKIGRDQSESPGFFHSLATEPAGALNAIKQYILERYKSAIRIVGLGLPQMIEQHFGGHIIIMSTISN
jgi:hypothetical protein